MKYYKIIALCGILYAFVINSSEQPVTTSEEATQEQQTSEVETTAQPAPTEQKVEQKDELQEWQDYLKTLLIKGAFWNSSSNTPTDDWISAAYDKAKNLLTKDISRAQELKTSFLATINEKFLTIEKGTDLTAIAAVINDFNKKIDDLVQELSGTQPTEEKKEEPQETPVAPADEPKPEIPSEPTEAEPTELSPEEKAEQEKQKEEKKLKQLWQENLENVKSEGLTQDEVQDMVEEVLTLIDKLLERFPSEVNTFNGEFLDAVDIRKTKALAQLSAQDIQRITQAFGIQEPSPELPSTMPTQPSIAPEVTAPEKKELPKSNDSQKELPQQQLGRQTQRIITIQESSQVQQESAAAAQKAATEQRLQAQREQLQKSLALKIQAAAQQKIAAEREAAQKGILSSIAETILGEWWTGPSEIAKNQKELRLAQDQELDKLLLHRLDPETDTPVSQDAKEMIKTAYHNFQDILLAFSSPKFWDAQESRPTARWIQKLKSPLKILAKYQIITHETIVPLLHNTFKTNKNMSIEGSDTIKAAINDFVVQVEKDVTNTRLRLRMQKEKEQRQRIEEQQRVLESQRLAEQQKQDELIRQQQEEFNRLQQQEADKKAAFDQFKQLQNEWNSLLIQIAQTSSATIPQNEIWTNEALKTTESMLKLIPIIGTNNKKEIIDNHIADFSKAFIAQQRNNAEHINVHANIEAFNKGVHKL